MREDSREGNSVSASLTRKMPDSEQGPYTAIQLAIDIRQCFNISSPELRSVPRCLLF